MSGTKQVEVGRVLVESVEQGPTKGCGKLVGWVDRRKDVRRLDQLWSAVLLHT